MKIEPAGFSDGLIRIKGEREFKYDCKCLLIWIELSIIEMLKIVSKGFGKKCGGK